MHNNYVVLFLFLFIGLLHEFPDGGVSGAPSHCCGGGGPLPGAVRLHPHLPAPSAGAARMVQVAGFWLKAGSEAPSTEQDYVITASVKRNLRNLARVVSAR